MTEEKKCVFLHQTFSVWFGWILCGSGVIVGGLITGSLSVALSCANSLEGDGLGKQRDGVI